MTGGSGSSVLLRAEQYGAGERHGFEYQFQQQ